MSRDSFRPTFTVTLVELDGIYDFEHDCLVRTQFLLMRRPKQARVVLSTLSSDLNVTCQFRASFLPFLRNNENHCTVMSAYTKMRTKY